MATGDALDSAEEQHLRRLHALIVNSFRSTLRVVSALPTPPPHPSLVSPHITLLSSLRPHRHTYNVLSLPFSSAMLTGGLTLTPVRRYVVQAVATIQDEIRHGREPNPV